MIKSSILISLLTISCILQKKTADIHIQVNNLYEVTKIDSIKNVYLIYAKRNDSTYKIMSVKSETGDCRNIIVGHAYNFRLSSSFGGEPDSFPKLPLNHLSGLRYDGITISIDEDGIVRDLFYDDNIKGLCFSPQPK